jgi:hypothetical protein
VTKDDRPREEQLKKQVGPFRSEDLDEDGVFSPDKWLARLTIANRAWEAAHRNEERPWQCFSTKEVIQRERIG